MQHQTSTLKTEDGLTLFTQSWQPDNPDAINGVVVIVHGYGEHAARYAHLAEKLVEADYAVYGIDHRGHGKSEGLQAYFTSIDEPTADLKRYIDDIRAKHPAVRLFLYGHSMGTLITLQFLQTFNPDLAGVMLSGVATHGDEAQPAAVVAIGKLLANIMPKAALIPGLPSDGLSTDPVEVKKYDADPLVYHGAWRLGLATALLSAGQSLRPGMSSIDVPLLIMHGGDDEITPVSGSKYLYEHAGSADKTLRIYDGMRHEIINERERDMVMDEMLAWLNAH